MEKKIEVEIDGRRYKILPHMLEDASRFGASVIKRQVKEIPKELLIIPTEVKKVILPPTNLEPLPVVPEVKEEVPIKKVTRKKK